jgi:hypothetical protein
VNFEEPLLNDQSILGTNVEDDVDAILGEEFARQLNQMNNLSTNRGGGLPLSSQVSKKNSSRPLLKNATKKSSGVRNTGPFNDPNISGIEVNPEDDPNQLFTAR